MNIQGYEIKKWYSWGYWHVRIDFGSFILTRHFKQEPSQLEIENIIEETS